jgi:hypothetical protein
LPCLILFPVRDLLVVYTIFFVFRPQDQEGTGPDDIITYTSDRKVLVKKTPKEFSDEFDWVFKPDSTQVNNFRYASQFSEIFVFIHLLGKFLST